MIEFEFNVAEVEGLAAKIGTLSSGALGKAAIAAVNAVTERFDKTQRAAQIADIALSQAYVDRLTDVALATDPRNAQATITTAGALTVMDRYPLSLVSGAGRTDRAGHALGKRSAGVRAGIKPSAPKEVYDWFLIRLSGTNGERTGVFYRGPTGKVTHKYGPSPYSLFKHQVRVGEAGILQDLETTGLAAMADAVEKALQ